jgi:hypothetical protein
LDETDVRGGVVVSEVVPVEEEEEVEEAESVCA